MNIQQYISSGIIESYLLGLVSDEESAELESMCRIYPELDIEIQQCQQRMERMMFDEPAFPPMEIKERIIQRINIDREVDPVTNYGFINIQPKKEGFIAVSRIWRLVVILLIVALNVAVFLASFYYYKYRQLQAPLSVPNTPHTTQVAPAGK